MYMFFIYNYEYIFVCKTMGWKSLYIYFLAKKKYPTRDEVLVK
jgi:hypothetical protein